MTVFRVVLALGLVVFAVYQVYSLIRQIIQKVKSKREKELENVNKNEEEIIDGVVHDSDK